MELLKKNCICYYCIGCNRLELEEFHGIANCKNFTASEDGWFEKFINQFKNGG